MRPVCLHLYGFGWEGTGATECPAGEERDWAMGKMKVGAWESWPEHLQQLNHLREITWHH